MNERKLEYKEFQFKFFASIFYVELLTIAQRCLLRINSQNRDRTTTTTVYRVSTLVIGIRE